MTTKLYCFGESGHSYKVALMLELCGLDWEPVHVDFFKGEARSKEYGAVNPMQEVPVMIYDGKRYSQSGVMLDILTRDTGKFGPETEDERLEILRWILWDNHKLSAQLGALRFQMNYLAEKYRSNDVRTFMAIRCRTSLNILESHLYNRDWIACDRPTTADFSCCSYLYYPEEFGFDRTKYPNIDAWLTRLSELPRWKHPYDLMQRAYA